MEARNLLAIIGSNVRLNFKQTFFPAVIFLLVIPLIYGTFNLDSIKSADCLGRMVVLVGLPMFIPLLRPEQYEGMDALISLRPFPYRLIVSIRVCFSMVCTFALILVFELYMIVCGCMFPVCPYAIRTLAASMLLGFWGLLASAISKNTIVGYLVAFCLYCALQTEVLSNLFSPVSSDVGIPQILLLFGCELAIIFFSQPDLDVKSPWY